VDDAGANARMEFAGGSTNVLLIGWALGIGPHPHHLIRQFLRAIACGEVAARAAHGAIEGRQSRKPSIALVQAPFGLRGFGK
jgi:hypothetical protein